MTASRCPAARVGLSIAVVAALLALPRVASAYHAASHVVLCQDLVASLAADALLPVSPSGSQDACGASEQLTVPAAVRAAILAHPGFFLGGCVGPDAHLMPLFAEVTHAEAFDPLALARILLDDARDDPELAYAYGWLAHLATDAAVSGFADWYAEGTLAQWDPAQWSTWGYFARHLLAEDHVAQRWLRPVTPVQLEAATALLRRVFMRWDGPGFQHLLRRALGHSPAPGADPVAVLVELLTAGRPPGVGRVAQVTVATLGVFAATDAYAARFEWAVRDGHAAAAAALDAAVRGGWLAEYRPATWRARVTAAFYERSQLAVRAVREQLAADEDDLLAQNVQFAADEVDDGRWAALVAYLPSFEGLPAVLAGRLHAIDSAAGTVGWAPEVVASLADAAPRAAQVLGVGDLTAYVRDRYDVLAATDEGHAWPWLDDKAVDQLAASAIDGPFAEVVALFGDLTQEALAAAFPVRYDLIDGDFEAAGVIPDTPYAGEVGCAEGYHFYHNARVLSWGALVAPRNLDGLVSADGPCELRGTRFFRRYDGGDYTTFARDTGPDPSAERPYCFAAGPSYTTRFAADYIEERDWPFVDRCDAGHSVRERRNDAPCAPHIVSPGRCPSGAVAFFSDAGSPNACWAGGSTTDIWLTAPGDPPTRVWRSIPGACGSAPCTTVTPYASALSPDGVALAFVDVFGAQQQIRVARLDGGEDLTYPSVATTFAWDFHWAPDSHAVAFVADAQGGRLGAIVVLDVTDGTTTVLLRGFHPRWAHDSASLYFFAPNPGAGASGRMVRRTFGPCGVTAPIETTAIVPREVPLAVSHDGRVLYYRTPYSAQSPYAPAQGNLTYGIRSADGASAATFTLPFATDVAAWTPDGRRLVMAAVSAASAPWSHVYLVDVGEGLPYPGTTPVVTDLGRGSGPRLSRDGRWLGYVRYDATSSACGSASDSPGPMLGIAVLNLAVAPPVEVLVTGLGPCEPGASCACAEDLPFAWSTTPNAAILFASFWGGDKPWPHASAPGDRDLFAFDVPTGLVWESLTADQATFSAPFTYEEFDPAIGQLMTRCDPSGRATNEGGVKGVEP